MMGHRGINGKITRSGAERDCFTSYTAKHFRRKAGRARRVKAYFNRYVRRTAKAELRVFYS